MKRYSAYKPSGIQWLPKVPAHWEVLRFGSLFKRKPAINKPEEELLSVFLDRGVIKASESDKRTHQASEDLGKYQLVEPSDFVMNNQQAWRGSVGVSDYMGIISPAYHIFPMPSCFDAHYANYLLRDRVMVNLFDISSKGVGSIQRTLNFNWLNNGKCLLPPIEEQKRIVAYLDKKITLIESCKCQRERELQTLNELKQAEIASVVTRGLNPNVPMKDSGISWIGMIPAHWETKRLASHFHNRIESNSDFEYKHAFKFNYGTIVPKEETGNPEEYHDVYVKYSKVKKNDIIINGLNLNYDFVSQRVAIVPENGIITSAYVVLRPFETTYAPYYCYLFKAMDSMKLFHAMGTGIRLTLSFDELKKQIIPIPPVEEQKAIVDYIEKRSNRIDLLIDNLKKEIDNLQEYKLRLISDVVTGQVDVRDEEIA